MLSRLRKAARELVAPSAAAARGIAAPAHAAVRAPEPVEHTFDSACPPGPILHIDRCPVCAATEATPVCRYNKFITYEQIPDAACIRYDYALCHECGIVYATRRPGGERYDWPLSHFEETIGPTAPGAKRSGSLHIRSYSLTAAMRQAVTQVGSM